MDFLDLRPRRCLVTAISLGFQVRRIERRIAEKVRRGREAGGGRLAAKQVLEVLTAPSANRVLLTASKAKPAPTARAVYLAESGGLILQANDLEQLAQDKSMGFGFIPANGQAPIPAGLFRPDAAGSASVVLPPLPKGVPAKAFGVTIEEAEGSATPTAPILLAGAVPTSGESLVELLKATTGAQQDVRCRPVGLILQRISRQEKTIL